MKRIRTLYQAEQALSRFIGVGRSRDTYALDRMNSLMRRLGNPQEAIRVVHVAGTSGKTSTSYYVAALLVAAGHKVGLTVSPHINKVSERAQINLKPLEEKRYCDALNEFLSLVDESEIVPTYFEIVTAFAFWLFERERVDFAVVEVGLGGLLDATNVVYRPDKICVITDIGYDHMEILGNTLDSIAHQKAGIIHQGNSVYVHPQSPPVDEVVRLACMRTGARLRTATTEDLAITRHLPAFQRRNFSLALEAVRDEISKSATPLERVMIRGAAISIPARMQICETGDGQVILDGSHNNQKIAALVSSVLEKYERTDIAIVLSFGENKSRDLERNLQILRQVSDNVICTQFTPASGAPRLSVPAELTALAAEKAGFRRITIVRDPHDALRQAKESRRVVLVTGSFFLVSELVGEVMASRRNHSR